MSRKTKTPTTTKALNKIANKLLEAREISADLLASSLFKPFNCKRSSMSECVVKSKLKPLRDRSNGSEDEVGKSLVIRLRFTSNDGLT